jgi:hypothetical protein
MSDFLIERYINARPSLSLFLFLHLTFLLNMITVGVLFLLGLCCQIIQAQKEWTAPILDARSPKNIGFGAVGGGSSHYLWVMEILQELTSRGHVSTLYTRVSGFEPK